MPIITRGGADVIAGFDLGNDVEIATAHADMVRAKRDIRERPGMTAAAFPIALLERIAELVGTAAEADPDEEIEGPVAL